MTEMEVTGDMPTVIVLPNIYTQHEKSIVWGKMMSHIVKSKASNGSYIKHKDKILEKRYNELKFLDLRLQRLHRIFIESAL